MSEFGLVYRAALLFLHDVVPCADVWLAFDYDSDSGSHFVVLNHESVF
jgi:hypothetical protein